MRTCLICRAPLAAHGGPTCGRALCLHRFQHLTEANRCPSCHCALTPEEQPRGVCRDPECERKQIAVALERERQQIEILTQQADRLRAADGAADARRYRLILIPSYRRSAVPLSEERRRNFREVLAAAIQRALTTDPADDPDEPVKLPPVDPMPDELHGVLSQACGLCRGKCCQLGQDHAFISVRTLRRYMAAHPDATPKEVMTEYMAYLGETSNEYSCVFNQPTGCALPRDMRSDTCNNAFCAGLYGFIDSLDSGDPARGFFAATHEDAVVAAAFIDADGAREVFSTRE